MIIFNIINLKIYFLLAIRKIYRNYFKIFKIKKFKENYIKQNKVILDPNKTSELISKIILENKPKLITRLGRTEFNVVLNYLSLRNKKLHILNFIRGKTFENWWHQSLINQIYDWSGFFPKNKNKLEKFSKLYISNIKNIDCLGVVLENPYIEDYFKTKLKKSTKVNIYNLGGFHSNNSWVQSLKNKKVLVIHPFTDTIKKQYIKRDKIFKRGYLPKFKLKTLKAVQSIGGETDNFKHWFKALKYMKDEMEKIDFDIALIGCGAYGYPLAAHAKKIGKIGFHLGGELQLIFGIIGKRYENLKHFNSFPITRKMVNKYWCRPSIKERPTNYKKVEDGCYW